MLLFFISLVSNNYTLGEFQQYTILISTWVIKIKNEIMYFSVYNKQSYSFPNFILDMMFSYSILFKLSNTFKNDL